MPATTEKPKKTRGEVKSHSKKQNAPKKAKGMVQEKQKKNEKVKCYFFNIIGKNKLKNITN